MKPPRSGRAQCAGHTRRRVRPLPSVGGAAPHMQHGSIISRVAAASLIVNGTRCCSAIRWYARSRWICGSTRDDADDDEADGPAGFVI